jgi:hypothetical protein
LNPKRPTITAATTLRTSLRTIPEQVPPTTNERMASRAWSARSQRLSPGTENAAAKRKTALRII